MHSEVSRQDLDMATATKPTKSIIVEKAAQELRRIVQKLANVSELEFCEPEQRIITQGDRSVDCMYVIQSGQFIVTEDGLRNQQIVVCQLQRSSFFGEVGLYYDSFRTASVSANNYGEVGKIKREDIYTTMQEHPILFKYIQQSMLNYKDSNRLFLMNVLRTKVPYMASADEQIISDLTFSMKCVWLEQGQNLFREGDKSVGMFIIKVGTLEIFTTLDNGLPITIERLQRGSVLGQYTFLLEDDLEVGAKCASQVCVYFIPKDRFQEIVFRDPRMTRTITNLSDQILQNDQNLTLDYMTAQNTIKHPRKGIVTGAKAQKAIEVSLLLKQAIMGFIIQNRERHRAPRLDQIIASFVQKTQRIKRLKRLEFEKDPFNAGEQNKYLTGYQFEMVEEALDKLHGTLEQTQTNLDTVQKKMWQLVRPRSSKAAIKNRKNKDPINLFHSTPIPPNQKQIEQAKEWTEKLKQKSKKKKAIGIKKGI